MLSISAIKDRGMRLIPLKTVWVELLGLSFLALGLLLALATISYNPADFSPSSQNVANLAGPFGVFLAKIFLGGFGIVGLIWPVSLTLMGLLVTLGFVREINPKRVLGFVLLCIFSSAIAQIALTILSYSPPHFGFGGKIGLFVGSVAARMFGLSGSLIILSICAVGSLVMTGNMTMSRTYENVKYCVIVLSRFLKQVYKNSLNKPLSDDELIRSVIAKELRSSQSKGSSKAHPNSASVVSRSEEIQKLPAKKQKGLVKTPRQMIDELVSETDQSQMAGATAEAEAAGKIEFYYEGGARNKPQPSLFSRSTKIKSRKQEFEVMAQKLTKQLAQFKVEGRVKKIVEGPVVTTYEFEPVAGTKLSKITALSQDLARLLQAKSLRILAPIPGKKVCGFEVPNEERKTIGFADLAEHRDLRSSKIQLPIAMGVDVVGNPVIEDLAKMPHLLVAGSTGSGKSVFMNSLIASLICRHSPKDLRFVMIDPKMVELVAYNDIPHMACPVVSDPSVEAKAKLDALVVEMEDRFRKMQTVGARNIQSFNEIVHAKKKTAFPSWQGKWQPMPYIVLIIDELADMMMVLGKDVEIPITRLAQKARAAGIHLVIATQRPSAEVVTGLIKSNFPTRVAFRVLSGLDSRTILDQNGAETLIGQGDMLYLNSGGVARMHGAFLSEGEVHKMVKATRG